MSAPHGSIVFASLKNFVFRNIFLIDGVGALISALMLSLVLPQFDLGIPNEVFALLALIALVFSIYSLSCFFLSKVGGGWLKAIAVANLSYCSLTGLIVLYFYKDLAALAVVYFVAEIFLVVALARLELRISRPGR